MGKKNLLKSLKDSLRQSDINRSSDLLLAIYHEYGKEWINCIKLNGILPEPLSNDFSREAIATFIKSLQYLISHIHFDDIGDIESAFRLSISILQLRKKIDGINERLERSEFFNFSPVKQIQLLSTFIEDQARIAEGKLLQNTQVDGIVSRMDLAIENLEDKNTGRKRSVIGNLEAMGDVIDLILRYIFWKYRKDKDAFDGRAVRDIPPYYLRCFHEIIAYADMRVCINELWQNIKYRDWISFLKDGITYYSPTEINRYIKEEASAIRYSLYLSEIAGISQFYSLTQDQLFVKVIEDINIEIRDIPWQPKIENEQVNRLMSLFTRFEVLMGELFGELYKKNINDLMLGPKGKQVNGRDLLQACKYIYVLSYIYQKQSWQSIDFNDASQYFSLTPVLEKSDLVNIFSQNISLSRETCENALDLLCFNPKYTKLDLWLQPLVPIGNSRYILIPIIGQSPNLLRLFECHMAQWEIRLDDRGTLFEDEIRNRLKELGIPVVSHSIGFEASDGKEVEYDVISWFKDYLLLIEAKCLHTPYSPTDRYNCWQEIKNGIEQLKRRRELANSNWDTIVKQSDIELPKIPPEEKNILCLLITNVFTFTGIELDNVRVCDLTCLYRYLAEPTIDGMIVGSSQLDKQEFMVGRIWAGSEPTPEELWNYIHNPIGLSTILNKAKIGFSPIPRLNEEDKDLLCFAHIVIED